ncbi:MAG: DEAD/DEAH box helicase family protein [Candidatus Pacebacteria bacterium]|nr:DEAD/DEAH box helicase family protein [Candidatus Paceibacterota bacterium]
MNESETRAEYIDPKLKESGWGVIEGSKVHREFRISPGKIEMGGVPQKPEIADYVLVYKNRKLAVIEAKKESLAPTEGVQQAKTYAGKLQVAFSYSTNGHEIHEIDMKNGIEGPVITFPTPEELFNKIYSEQNEWKNKFSDVAFEDVNGSKSARYYQEIAVNRVMDAVAEEKPRVLLTLATGTGKTFIAFQIAWKLFQSRWNISRDGKRQPRILFLADRNILADQAFNAFSAFPEDALVRITPNDIRKKGGVPMNGSIFFAIFQTFMSGPDETPYFGEYPKDYFDLIIIDECHRGGANDESNWRGILEYFSSAVQLGLTATPKRIDNVDTYKYFGEPVYIYSLKEGINDGFLTPFKVKRIKTTLDEYIYTSDDTVVEGEVEEGKIYKEDDFARGNIHIREREENRVKVFLNEINQNEKTIVFCATQGHALLVRDFINKHKKSSDPNYCVRVTANDGFLGEEYLRQFQDNEKSIPTILTTSQKLSTGVDARNVRNIVLMRPVNSMIEFKQIIGRGTRLFDGKEYFTIIDFVDAYHHFLDPEWDGEPIDQTTEDETKPPTEPRICEVCGQRPCVCEVLPPPPAEKLKIKLRDGKEREIQHMISTSFWSADGKPISTEEFLNSLYGALPDLFKDEKQLREIWSNPQTRKALLEKLGEMGYGKEQLESIQKIVNAENSDLFDVLGYIAFALQPISRVERIQNNKYNILDGLNEKQRDFIEFALAKYQEKGVEELGEDKLPILLNLKYHAIANAEQELGEVIEIRSIFFGFQKLLYK